MTTDTDQKIRALADSHERTITRVFDAIDGTRKELQSVAVGIGEIKAEVKSLASKTELVKMCAEVREWSTTQLAGHQESCRGRKLSIAPSGKSNTKMMLALTGVIGALTVVIYALLKLL